MIYDLFSQGIKNASLRFG